MKRFYSKGINFVPDLRTTLEEFRELPFLDKKKLAGLKREDVIRVNEFEPRVTPLQLQEGLNCIAQETDFNEFVDMKPCYVKAQHLIKEAIRQKANGEIPPQEFIQSECESMLKEIETGDYSRYAGDSLMEGIKDTEEMRMAAQSLGKNQDIHPLVKKRMMKEINKYST